MIQQYKHKLKQLFISGLYFMMILMFLQLFFQQIFVYIKKMVILKVSCYFSTNYKDLNLFL